MAQKPSNKQRRLLPSEGQAFGSGIFRRFGFTLERHQSGIDLGASDSGDLRDASTGEALMHSGSVHYIHDSRYFANLQRNFCEFAQAYPDLIAEFLSALRYRSMTPGFPEYPLKEHATQTVIATLFRDEPTETSLTAARSISPTEKARFEEVCKENPDIIEYIGDVSGSLSKFFLVDPDIIESFFDNLHRKPENIAIYIAALHVEYISRRDDVLF